MTKPLTKVRTCPTCGIRYKASETFYEGRPGRTCPAGHFATYYQLQKAENGGAPPVQRRPRPRPPIPTITPSQEHSELLALLLWIGAVDRLLMQLPERSTARAMVEGATAQAYSVSRKLIMRDFGCVPKRELTRAVRDAGTASAGLPRMNSGCAPTHTRNHDQ